MAGVSKRFQVAASNQGLADLEHRSIRRRLAGAHEVELQVNGVRSPMGRFDLVLVA